MKEFLVKNGSNTDEYSVKHLKRKLAVHFREDIMFSETDGKPNVVTLLSTANKILNNFYNQKRTKV